MRSKFNNKAQRTRQTTKPLNGKCFPRVPPLIDTIPGIQGDKPNPQYLDLAGSTETEFVRDAQQFEARWNNFPHHLSPSREPIILFRNALFWTAL